jgi:hypothetical protein
MEAKVSKKEAQSIKIDVKSSEEDVYPLPSITDPEFHLSQSLYHYHLYDIESNRPEKLSMLLPTNPSRYRRRKDDFKSVSHSDEFSTLITLMFFIAENPGKTVIIPKIWDVNLWSTIFELFSSTDFIVYVGNSKYGPNVKADRYLIDDKSWNDSHVVFLYFPYFFEIDRDRSIKCIKRYLDIVSVPGVYCIKVTIPVNMPDNEIRIPSGTIFIPPSRPPTSNSFYVTSKGGSELCSTFKLEDAMYDFNIHARAYPYASDFTNGCRCYDCTLTAMIVDYSIGILDGSVLLAGSDVLDLSKMDFPLPAARVDYHSNMPGVILSGIVRHIKSLNLKFTDKLTLN